MSKLLDAVREHQVQRVRPEPLLGKVFGNRAEAIVGALEVDGHGQSAWHSPSRRGTMSWSGRIHDELSTDTPATG